MRRCVLSSLKKKREKRRVHDFLLSRLIILLTRDSLRAFFFRSDVKTDLPVEIDVDDDDRCRWGSFERSFIRVSIIFQ